jgi:hypothetical protein
MITESMMLDEQIEGARYILRVLEATKDDATDPPPWTRKYSPEQVAARLAWVAQARRNIIINTSLDLLAAQDPEWRLLEPLWKQLESVPPSLEPSTKTKSRKGGL